MAVGIMAMITLMSVFNGFESLVRDMFNVFYADLRVSPEAGKYFDLTEENLVALRDLEGVASLSTILEEDALLEYGDEQFVATLKGVERNYFDIIALSEEFIIQGVLELDRERTPLAVLGRGVANGLGVNINNPFAQVKVSVPRKNAPTSSIEQAFNFNSITPIGVFNIQQEFDERYVLVPQFFLREIQGGSDEYSSIEIKLTDGASEARVAEAIWGILPGVNIDNRWQQNSTLYQVMRTEKWVFFAILTLILLIVSFSITGTLSMLIVDKKKDIGVLRAMGASARTINKIFIAEGVLLAVQGAFFGILITIVLCLLQQHVGIIPMPGNTFVVDYYPVKMQFWDFVAASFVVFFISMIASYFPTVRAARDVRLSEMMRVE